MYHAIQATILSNVTYVCPTTACASNLLAPEQIIQVYTLGLSPSFYAVYIIVLDTLATLVYGGLAAVIVIATLTIVALFHPLRRWIQTTIDRRFYRRKYDAASTLAAFSATLRDEVDLQSRREDMVSIVEETMRPAHLSLWLRPLERSD